MKNTLSPFRILYRPSHHRERECAEWGEYYSFAIPSREERPLFLTCCSWFLNGKPLANMLLTCDLIRCSACLPYSTIAESNCWKIFGGWITITWERDCGAHITQLGKQTMRDRSGQHTVEGLAEALPNSHDISSAWLLDDCYEKRQSRKTAFDSEPTCNWAISSGVRSLAYWLFTNTLL